MKKCKDCYYFITSTNPDKPEDIFYICNRYGKELLPEEINDEKACYVEKKENEVN